MVLQKMSTKGTAQLRNKNFWKENIIKKYMNISMEKVDLIERKVLLQNNEKVSARKTYHQC